MLSKNFYSQAAFFIQMTAFFAWDAGYLLRTNNHPNMHQNNQHEPKRLCRRIWGKKRAWTPCKMSSKRSCSVPFMPPSTSSKVMSQENPNVFGGSCTHVIFPSKKGRFYHLTIKVPRCSAKLKIAATQMLNQNSEDSCSIPDSASESWPCNSVFHRFHL